MLTLSATNTIAGVAGTTTAITYSIFGMTLLSDVETYSVLSQGQLATSAGAIYTVPGSTTAFVKHIQLVNTTGSPVSGIILYVNGTAAGNQITGSISIPANGMAMIADDGLSVYDANGSKYSAILSQTATALLGASALPAGTTAVTQTALDNTTKVATTAYTDAAVAAYALTNTTIFQTTKNLSYGTQPVRSGKFTITGVGWTPGAQVFVVQASARPNSVLTDSIQTDPIIATGYVVNSTTIEVNWASIKGPVANDYTFNYWFGN